MGSCFSRCFGGQNARTRNYMQRVYYDRANSTEFESLMDETPVDEPLSISSMLSFRRRKYARQDEMLELEEEAFIDARNEAIRVSKLDSYSHQIINPARLVLVSDTSWVGDESHWNIAETTIESLPSLSERFQGLVNRGYSSRPHSRTGSSSSNGNGYGRDKGQTCTSTPPSSVDLEWEHEAGFFCSSSSQPHSKTEEEVTATVESEKCATPLSNELEWDDGFVSPEPAELDMETEQLICEIEQLTSQALQETMVHSNNLQR